jgi:hypothetical protein
MLRYISFLQANVAIYRDIWFIFYRQMSFQMSRHPRKGQEGLPPPHRKQKHTSVTAVTSVIRD